MAVWDPSKHARNAKGPGGGEFASGGSGSSAKLAKGKPAARRTVPKGSLGYDGKRGTGYGSPHGDARVRRLQQALNRLGLKDSHGKPLKVDGKLGPLTTSAIEAWQKRNGMKATGMLDAASLHKLTGGTRSTHHVRARAALRGSSSSSGRAPRTRSRP